MGPAKSKEKGGFLRHAVGSPPFIALMTVLFLVVFSRAFSFIEWRAYDVLWSLTPTPGLDDRIALLDTGVAGDHYEHLRPTPGDGEEECECSIPRTAYADLVDKLSGWGTKVVIFDMFFKRTCKLEDPNLARALTEAGNVVIAATTEIATDHVLFEPTEGDEASDIVKAAWAVASPVAHRPGQDVRMVPMMLKDAAEQELLALSVRGFMRFADIDRDNYSTVGGQTLVVGDLRIPLVASERLSLLQRAAKETEDISEHGIELVGGTASANFLNWYAMLVDWGARASQMEPLLLSDVLDLSDDEGSAAFDGKAVILGREAFDEFHTTMGKMPGPQIQANALHTLITGRFVHRTNQWGFLLWIFALGTVSSLAVRKIKTLGAVIVLACVLALALAVSRQLLASFRIFHYAFFSVACLGTSYLATNVAQSRAVGSVLRRLVPKFMTGTGARDLDEVRTTVATVLFSDIRNFTTISEKLGAENMIHLIREYRHSVEQTIGDHGGTIVVTPGDAILAVFWQEHRGTNHSTCALRAGRELLAHLPDWATSWEQQGVPLQVGVGINTGNLAMGTLGTEDMQVTVIGDAVNVAARLESITKDLGHSLIFSETVLEELQDDIETFYIDEVSVKGREEPLKVYGAPALEVSSGVAE